MKPSEALIRGRKLIPGWTDDGLFYFNDTGLPANAACALGAMWAGYHGEIPTEINPIATKDYWWNNWDKIRVHYPCSYEGDYTEELIEIVIAHLSDTHHKDGSFTEDKMIEWLEGMGL